jgi:hypothetical protein
VERKLKFKSKITGKIALQYCLNQNPKSKKNPGSFSAARIRVSQKRD